VASKAVPKPVKAWALVDRRSRQLWALWTFDEKSDVHDPHMRAPGVAKLDEDDRWIRVEIRPLRRAARGKRARGKKA